MGVPKFICQECGATVSNNEVHDYAACILYRFRTDYEGVGDARTTRQKMLADIESLLNQLHEARRNLAIQRDAATAARMRRVG